ncbi:MAG: helix-turn-helix transcriptional regulator [Defluviitaleaceae bacterium]|nr:helix-turn-helix transcriptional regulator [Defluviitaleaceae bacterium]
MENNNSLSNLLIEIAQERQFSLRAFAKVLGISHAYIGKLMAGVNHRSNRKISPTIDTLLKIADALEIPREEFLRKCGYFDKRPGLENKLI